MIICTNIVQLYKAQVYIINKYVTIDNVSIIKIDKIDTR